MGTLHRLFSYLLHISIDTAGANNLLREVFLRIYIHNSSAILYSLQNFLKSYRVIFYKIDPGSILFLFLVKIKSGFSS